MLLLSACAPSNGLARREVEPLVCAAEGLRGCPPPEGGLSVELPVSDLEDIRNYGQMALCRARYALLRSCVEAGVKAGYVVTFEE